MLLVHRRKDKTCPQTAQGEAHLLAQHEGGDGAAYRGLLGILVRFQGLSGGNPRGIARRSSGVSLLRACGRINIVYLL